MPIVPEDFVFETGDIRILVKHNGEVIEGKVSSQSLCNASFVWTAKLRPLQDENDNELRHSVKQVDCAEDNAEALLIVLNICHLKFDKIPERLSYEQLLQIALLCEKYKCVGTVKMWLTEQAWLHDVQRDALDPECAEWVQIAKVFGLKEIFEQIIRREAKNIDLQDDYSMENLALMPSDIKGKCTSVSGLRILLMFSVTDAIFACRRVMINQLLNIPHDLLEKCLNYHKKSTNPTRKLGGPVCDYGSRQNCEATVYGTIVLHLARVGLFPRPQPEDVSTSVCNLTEMIRRLASKCLLSRTHQVGTFECHVDRLGTRLDAVTKLFDLYYHSPMAEVFGESVPQVKVES